MSKAVTCLLALPLPPSANSLYAYRKVRLGAQRGKIKTKEYRAFEKRMQDWALINGRQLQVAKEFIQKLNKHSVLDIKTVFYFQSKRIWTKDWRPKRLDTSNYLKALHDVVASLLDIDDCYFWNGSYEKIALGDAHTPEHVDVIISMV